MMDNSQQTPPMHFTHCSPSPPSLPIPPSTWPYYHIYDSKNAASQVGTLTNLHTLTSRAFTRTAATCISRTVTGRLLHQITQRPTANRPHHDPHHHYRDTYHQIHPTIPMEGSEDPPTTPDPPIAHCLIKVKSHQIKANTMDISHTQPYPAFALANHWVDQLTNKPNPTSHHSDHPPPPLPPPQPIHTPLLLSGHIFFHGNTYIDTDAPSFIQTQYHKELLHRMRRLPSMGWIANDGQLITDPTHALHSLFTLPSILTHTTLNMALLSHLRLQKCSIPGWHPH
jgi:hypothetical protein